MDYKILNEVRHILLPELQSDCTYLDYMGCTPYVDVRELAKCLGATALQRPHSLIGNPHSSHNLGQRSFDIILELRRRVLTMCGASPTTHVCLLTSGTTGGCRLVSEHLARLHGGSYFVDAFFAHGLSHNSVLGMREPLSCAMFQMYNSEDELRTSFITLRDIRAMVEPTAGRQPVTLVAFPAECNFSGKRLDIELTSMAFRRLHAEVFGAEARLLLFCDGAAAFGKHLVNVSDHVDFFAFSFYKAFGGPTGLGGLIVKAKDDSNNSVGLSAAALLQAGKRYFGGGSVLYVLPSKSRHGLKGCRHLGESQPGDWEDVCQSLEDGTQHFIGASEALSWLKLAEEVPALLSPSSIGARIHSLRLYCVSKLSMLRHSNGHAVIQLLNSSDVCSPDDHQLLGSSVPFLILDAEGQPKSHVECEEALRHHPNHIALRGGGFCNPGACSTFLGVTEEDLLDTFCASSGEGSPSGKCFDDFAFSSSGRPMGCLRVSFGVYSNPTDVDKLIEALTSCFYHTDTRSDAVTSSPANNIVEKIIESGTDASPSEDGYQLHSLYVYPIKGCLPIVPATSWPLCRSGLCYDRQWCIVRQGTTKPIAPKDKIEIASLLPSIIAVDSEGKEQDFGLLRLSSWNVSSKFYLQIQLPRTGTVARIQIRSPSEEYNATAVTMEQTTSIIVRGRAVGGVQQDKIDEGLSVVNSQLSLEIGLPVELIMAKGNIDNSSPSSPVSNFSNTGELLLISVESHEAVIKSISNPSEAKHISLVSYRPNIVVENIDKNVAGPLNELFWESVGLSNNDLSLVRKSACIRCSQVGVDPVAQQIQQQPLQAIRELCKRVLGAHTEEERRRGGVTANSIAFGAIFAPSLPSNSQVRLEIGSRVVPVPFI